MRVHSTFVGFSNDGPWIGKSCFVPWNCQVMFGLDLVLVVCLFDSLVDWRYSWQISFLNFSLLQVFPIKWMFIILSRLIWWVISYPASFTKQIKRLSRSDSAHSPPKVIVHLHFPNLSFGIFSIRPRKWLCRKNESSTLVVSISRLEWRGMFKHPFRLWCWLFGSLAQLIVVGEFKAGGYLLFIERDSFLRAPRFIFSPTPFFFIILVLFVLWTFVYLFIQSLSLDHSPVSVRNGHCLLSPEEFTFFHPSHPLFFFLFFPFWNLRKENYKNDFKKSCSLYVQFNWVGTDWHFVFCLCAQLLTTRTEQIHWMAKSIHSSVA